MQGGGGCLPLHTKIHTNDAGTAGSTAGPITTAHVSGTQPKTPLPNSAQGYYCVWIVLVTTTTLSLLTL